MSLGRHALSNFAASIFPVLVALVTVPFYLRFIGAERYGVLAIIWTLLGYFGFFDFGFGRAVAQRMARMADAPEGERSTLLWTGLAATFLLGIIGSLILWLGADYILTNIGNLSEQNRREASAAVFWLLPALPILLSASVLDGALQARMRFYELNSIQVLGNTLAQLVPLAVAATGRIELQALVPAVLAPRIITITLLYWQARKHVPLCGHPVFDRSHLKPLISYGGWISVTSILAPLLVTIDRLVIASVSGAKAAAYYTVPYSLVSNSMVISSSLSSALFPRLASSNPTQGKELAKQASAILVTVMTPVVITGLFLVQPFLELWVGKEFSANCTGVAELILLGVWVNATVIPHHARFIATENPRTIAFIFLMETPIYLLMLWQGVTQWGVVGAAGAWCLRVVLDTGILLRLNGVFVYTVRSTAFSILLVASAAVSVLIWKPTQSVHWVMAAVLLFISLFMDRQLIRKVYFHIRTHQVGSV